MKEVHLGTETFRFNRQNSRIVTVCDCFIFLTANTVCLEGITSARLIFLRNIILNLEINGRKSVNTSSKFILTPKDIPYLPSAPFPERQVE